MGNKNIKRSKSTKNNQKGNNNIYTEEIFHDKLSSSSICPSNSGFSDHNIFIKENGDVFAFGNNCYGQCGNGSLRELLVPTKIMNNPNVKSINLGWKYSFYLESNGDLYGCGLNSLGQLGIKKDKENKNIFKKITTNVVKVCASYFNTIIQKEDEKIFWSHGWDRDFEKTNGFKELDIDGVISFSSGEKHCLFLKENGEVWSMGTNNYGQCGFGKELPKIKEPKLLMTDKNIISVCCGKNFSIILTRDENNKTIMKSFGDNVHGQYGKPNRKEGDIGIIESFPKISSVHCGASHSLILTQEGDVYGSGDNTLWKVGLPNKEITYKYQKLNISNISYITTGEMHSVFVNNKNEIFVCGNGASGRLGNGNQEDITKPTLLEFDNLKMIHNLQISLEWSTDNHRFLGKDFKDKIFTFLLCLKFSKLTSASKIKVPKPVQHIIFKLSY